MGKNGGGLHEEMKKSDSFQDQEGQVLFRPRLSETRQTALMIAILLKGNSHQSRQENEISKPS